MSAGRCGSTSTMNYLNALSDFNIYGENYGFILDLLNCISTLDKFTKQAQSTKINSYDRYKLNKKYANNGFYYDDKKKLISIKNNLLNQIKLFFESEFEHIGFKEIRWLNYDLNILNILEMLYDPIIYIHLTRSSDDQAMSLKKTFKNHLSLKKIHEYIDNTNSAISKFLSGNHKKHIAINISDNTNFLETIKNFIIKDDLWTDLIV